MISAERRAEVAAFFAILILAVFLRFYQLDVRPLHHDESVHAWFSYNLNLNTYTYDPTYHGPFQFYIANAIFSIAGASDFTARLLPVFFGILLVGLAYPLRKQIGVAGYIILAFFLAISPSMLYYSRFFRNDIYMAVFSLTMVICTLRFVENQRALYLFIAGIAAALSFAAKENAVITMFIFLSFAVLYLLNERYNLTALANLILFGKNVEKPAASPGIEMLLRKNIRVIAFAFLIAIALYSVLLSNFFLRIDNLLGLESSDPVMRFPAPLRGIAAWIFYHGVGRISGPFFYYLPFLFLYELPIALFAIAGSIHYIRKKNMFMIFAVYWAITSLLIYSYIQEKVPWLVLHVLLPQCIIAACFIGEKIDELSGYGRKFRMSFLLILFVLFAFFVYSSFNVNYVNSYNPQEPLVFVQTSGDVRLIMNKIETLSNNSRYTPIAITTTDYWPFPWYLRAYTNVNYGGNFYFSNFIISSYEGAGIVEKELIGKGYVREDFDLRIWHVFEPKDVTLDFVLFRKVAVPNGALKLVFFYKPGETR